jgi:hypothetical protein
LWIAIYLPQDNETDLVQLQSVNPIVANLISQLKGLQIIMKAIIIGQTKSLKVQLIIDDDDNTYYISYLAISIFLCFDIV